MLEEMRAEKLNFNNGLDLVEFAGRKCWKSEPRGNPEQFARNLIKRGHTSVLEHHGVELEPGNAPHDTLMKAISQSGFLPARALTTDRDTIIINARTFLEVTENVEATIDVLKRPASNLRTSFDVVCDRAVSHEIVRHRVASFTQESQRYVNYDKHYEDLPIAGNFSTEVLLEREIFSAAAQSCWDAYQSLTEERVRLETQSLKVPDYLKPQHIRAILPNMTRTTLVVSQWNYEWDWYFKLRIANDAHPDIVVISKQMHDNVDDISFWESRREKNKNLRWGVSMGFKLETPRKMGK